jgi:cell division protein FtsB
MLSKPLDERAAGAPAFRQRELRDRWMVRALIFAGCVLLGNALVGDGGLLGTIRAREDYRRASDGLARLKAENAGLREQARRLQEDPAAIEMVAREELGLIRPGEILVRVKDVK